jgi:hypothetical protein
MDFIQRWASEPSLPPKYCKYGNRYYCQTSYFFGFDLQFIRERRAHAPLVASAEVALGFGVVVTENHLNRTATSGCVARLVRPNLCLLSSGSVKLPDRSVETHRMRP